MHLHGSDDSDSPIDVYQQTVSGVPHWFVQTTQATLPVPSTAPQYDYTGDGVVTFTDVLACDNAGVQPSWTNSANRFDVNFDGVVAPNDALVLIDHYNAFGEVVLSSGVLPGVALDVSRDRVSSVKDIEQLLDKLNGGTGGTPGSHGGWSGDCGYASEMVWYLSLGRTDLGNIEIDRVRIRAHDGDDTAGSKLPAVMFGGDGVDVLYGWEGADVLDGGGGEDYLYGQGGGDQIFGGPGHDWLIGDLNIPPYQFFHPGDDLLYGGDGDDQIFGYAENDQLFGGAGNDTIEGGDGDDDLSGADGADNLSGGNGNDSLAGEGGERFSERRNRER